MFLFLLKNQTSVFVFLCGISPVPQGTSRDIFPGRLCKKQVSASDEFNEFNMTKMMIVKCKNVNEIDTDSDDIEMVEKVTWVTYRIEGRSRDVAVLTPLYVAVVV